ncbi:MAG: hypothetical protein HDS93_00370 [Bacteroidales bacterium]|nr:hypothetical protein [Bacteroidales bacterium]
MQHIEHSLKPCEKVCLLTFKPLYPCGGCTFKIPVFLRKSVIPRLKGRECVGMLLAEILHLLLVKDLPLLNH